MWMLRPQIKCTEPCPHVPFHWGLPRGSEVQWLEHSTWCLIWAQTGPNTYSWEPHHPYL